MTASSTPPPMVTGNGTVHPPRSLRRKRAPTAAIAAAALLAAADVCWAALPTGSARAGARIAVIVAVICAVGSIVQLALAGAMPRATSLPSVAERLTASLLNGLRVAPWAELMVVAVLALEALHPAKPWHTAMLGIALLGYLLAVHLAETGAPAGVLRAQIPLIAAGAGLSAISVGAAALPGLPAGPASFVVRVVATVGVVAVGAMVIPTWAGGRD